MLQNLQPILLPHFIKLLFPKFSPRRLKLGSRWFAIFGLLFSFTSFSQTISISSPVSGVVEGGGSVLSYTVSLDNGVVNSTGGDITGDITWTGTATNAVDYSGPVTFAIANGSNSIGILVPVIDDAICEGNETVTATISNVSSGSVNPASSSSTATIFDDDCGALFISIGSAMDGVEGSSNITFDVFIEGGLVNTTGAPITGNISYAGSATPTNDYIPVNSFSIPNGANSTTITLTIIDDATIEPTEPVIPTLTGAPSIGSYANTTVTANIFDDDASSLSLSIGFPTDGTEGSTFVSYVVSIDNGMVNNTGSSIVGSINYTGTATNGADYSGVATFSIPDGAGSALVILVVLDDALVECNETVIATISNPNVGIINPVAGSSTAVIIDDECVQGSISIGSPVNGAEGISSTDVSFVVSLDNGATNTTGAAIVGNVNYTGTSSGADFTAPSSFSIPDGANSTTLVISVTDDLLLECDETVIATISTPSVGTIGNATSSAIIVDDECLQTTVSIVNPSDGVENGSDITFIFALDNGIINGTGADIVADITFTGTATASDDYLDFNTVTIADGFGFSTHVVTLIDDALPEPTESVIATISNPNFGTIGIAVDTAYIMDDDSTSGIEQLNLIDLSIYPNPTNSNINVVADQQMSSYSIIDLKGRVLLEGDIKGKEIQVNTESLSSGAYLISITFEEGTVSTRRIVKD